MTASTKFESIGLHLTVSTVACTLVVHAEGEIDVATAPLLRSALEAGVVAGCRHAIVDASEVSFLDAAGLNAMLSAFGRDARHSLRVRNPSGPARRLLELLDRCDLIEDQLDAPASTLGHVEVGRRFGRRLLRSVR